MYFAHVFYTYSAITYVYHASLLFRDPHFIFVWRPGLTLVLYPLVFNVVSAYVLMYIFTSLMYLYVGAGMPGPLPIHLLQINCWHSCHNLSLGYVVLLDSSSTLFIGFCSTCVYYVNYYTDVLCLHQSCRDWLGSLSCSLIRYCNFNIIYCHHHLCNATLG